MLIMDGGTGADFIDRGSCQSRSRSYSTGTLPMPHRHKMAESNRIRARLEASTVGLGELLLLKQNQHRAVESVKAMVMSNLPLEERMEQEKIFKMSIPSYMSKTRTQNLSLTDVEDMKPCSNEDNKENQLEDSGYGEGFPLLGETIHRKRSVSMDVSVARSLALTAKKLAKMSSKEALTQRVAMKGFHHDRVTRGSRSRTNSYNEPTCKTPDTSNRDDEYKHSHKERYIGSNGKMLKNLSNQREVGALQSDKNMALSKDKTLSGSFLSIGSSPKSFPSSPEYLNGPVTEGMFDGHFRSPRSLSNSKLIFEFPSPMHAILLHFDKTEEPVLNKNTLDDYSLLSPLSKASQYSPKSRALDRKVSHKSNKQNKYYKMRKDSSLGDTTIDFPSLHLMQTKNSEQERGIFVDDGVTAFIEMLASRGLARRKREVKSKSCKESGFDLWLDSSSNKKHKIYSDNKMVEGDSGISESSLKLSDEYVGGWEGSCLSSSGKRGSPISVRSSTSSKASLSSEEGYYSHPGSPKNKRDNEKISMHGSVSTASFGSSLFQSDNAEVSDEPQGVLKEKVNEMEVPGNVSEKIEIIVLPDSPGARRRRLGLNQEKSSIILTSSSESLKPPEKHRSPTYHSAPNSPKKIQRNLQFTFSSSLDISTLDGKTIHSTDSVQIAPMTDIVSPGLLKQTHLSSVGSNWSANLPMAHTESKNASQSRDEQLPSWNNTSAWSKVGSQQETSATFQRVHCLESPRTPTIKEEPRKEALLEEDPRANSSGLRLVIPSGHDESDLRSPPICQAPKVPSWRRKKKSQQANAQSQEISNLADEKNVSENVTIMRSSPRKLENTKSTTSSRYTDGLELSTQTNVSSSKGLNVSTVMPANVDVHRKHPDKVPKILGGTESKRETKELIFQYPNPGVVNNSPGQASGPPSTPTRKDIPQILKSWVESKKPIATHEQKIKQAVHSKSSSLPIPMVNTPLTPANSPGHPANHWGMSLGNSKRNFRSQEIFIKDVKPLSERQCQTLDRNLQGHSPPNVLRHLSPRIHNTNRSSSKPMKAKRDIVKTMDSSDDRLMVRTLFAPNQPNIPAMFDSAPRARSSSWSKGHNHSVSSKNAWVREIVVPCHSPASKAGASRPRSASFNLNTNRPVNNKSHMTWYHGRMEANDTFV